MNRKSVEERAKIIQLLTEGNSLRSASRIMDCSVNTVMKILTETGKFCADYQFKHLVNLPCKNVQVDEIWSFCYSKDKNTDEGVYDKGSIWTWIAICADTKLVPCWHVGHRDAATAKLFIDDLAFRMENRIQLSSDGYPKYREAVEGAFGDDVDFAMLNKLYSLTGHKRYLGSVKQRIIGDPEKSLVSTSYVERQNLSLRMSCRRFARKTNAFSKKLENHAAAIALHYMVYNYCRIHKTLRVTPAMAAGVTDKLWSIEDIAALV
jgi:IS1 family transposase